MKLITIIGGGASGLMAAYRLSGMLPEKAALVRLVEKKESVGRKLSATGNGRGNYSNKDMSLAHFHGSLADAGIVAELFEKYSADAVRGEFLKLGVIPVELENGRIYPASLSASTLTQVLSDAVLSNGVELWTDSCVKSLSPFEGGYKLRLTGAHKGEYYSDYVILATGGFSSPAFGADGDGYYLLRDLDIPKSEVRPGLCRLKLANPAAGPMKGLKQDARVSLGEVSVLDEILFTEDGVSGPAALALSRMAGGLIKRGESAALTINFFPYFSEEDKKAFVAWLVACAKAGSSIEKALAGSVPGRLIEGVCALLGLEPSEKIRTEQLEDIEKMLFAMTLPLSGTEDFTNAQVTIGGVKASALSANLEIKNYPGLFAAGELLDADGDCGGYNLQLAFATGLCCADSILGELK